MKTLFACCALLLSTVVNANSIYSLQVPLDLPKGNQPAGRYCVGHSFNASDTVTGTCQSLVVGSCGRCAPPYTATVYAANWDSFGNLTSDTFCGTATVTRSGPPVWTYQPGYNSSNCFLPTPPVYQPILLYDPRCNCEHWFGYITTSSNGAYELLTDGHAGVINQF